MRVVILAALTGAALSTVPARPTANVQESPSEIRALWVVRTSLASPASIHDMVRAARDHGFNTLLVQVRGRGDAYYSSAIEPRAADLQAQPADFDPLATVLGAAHAAGLSVHAWVNVNLVSSAVDLPIARQHIVQRHPSWLMVPRELAQDLARVKPASPAYVGRLARWARAQTEGMEGLYASPAIPEAAAHAEAVVRDLARRYAVDGVHFDYARYPSARFDYSPGALDAFRAAVRPTLAPAVRRELDARERIDVLAYPDALPARWKAFRVGAMTTLMGRLRTAVKDVRPSAMVTVAAAPDLRDAYDHKFQDWRAWLQADLVDAVAPMAYTTEPGRFAEQIAAARGAAGSRSVWAGIGAYRLTAAQTVAHIQTARRLGASGVVLFSYDSLVDPRQAAPDSLSIIGRSAFTTGPEAGSR